MRPLSLADVLRTRRRKYGNVERGAYDSKLEEIRHAELIGMERAGLITGLRHQPVYALIPNQRDASGKIVEKAVTYRADFDYTVVASGGFVVEDCKSPFTKTQAYVIKRKLMLHLHGIRVLEVARVKKSHRTDGGSGIGS
jgi:hypothetical protein